MASYYKYQNPSEIGAAPTLDWGTVINNVNQNLQAQEQQRYENREADKKLTNDILTKANEITASSDPNLGAIMQKSADLIKFNNFERYKLLKEGKIGRSDFAIFGQNTKSSIAQLDSFVKNWNPIYTQALDLRKKGLTTDLANAVQDVVGGFQNFKDKKLIQGNDGFLNTALIDPNTGKPYDSSLGIITTQTLTNVQNYTDLRMNLQDEANKYAKDMKPFITVYMKDGVRTLETPKQKDNPDYADFLNNAFNGVAVNNNKISDILTTYGDYKTDLTLKDSDNASKKITAIQSNGTFIADITPEMREEAKKIFERQLLSQVKYEETPRAEFAPSRAAGDGGKDKEKLEPFFGDVGFINRTLPTGKEYTTGLSQSIGNVSFSGGKGIEHVPEKIGYEIDPKTKKGYLWMQGYTITGKESTEGMFGEPSSNVTKQENWGNVTGYRTDSDTGKKVPVKTDKLTSDENYDVMSLYIKRIPNPSTRKLFKSVKEAEQYYANTYKQGVAKAKGGSQGEYTNITETNKGTIGVKNGKWYNIKTGKPIE
jgi:hypothetical protein